MRPYSFSKPKIRRLRGLGCNMRVQTEYQPAPPSSTEGHDPTVKIGCQPKRKPCWYDEPFEVSTCAKIEKHSRRLLKKAVSKAAGELKPEA